jgi:ankyrin repeat protein
MIVSPNYQNQPKLFFLMPAATPPAKKRKKVKKVKDVKGKGKQKATDSDEASSSSSAEPVEVSLPLHEIAQVTNDPFAVSRVMEANPNTDVNAVDTDGFTALSLAAACGHHHVVRGLCDLGATVDLPSNGTMTPLMDTCYYMNVYLNAPQEHPGALAEDGADEDEAQGTVPDFAETVRCLLLSGANPNTQVMVQARMLSPLDVLWLEEATPQTAMVASKCAQHLVMAGVDLQERDADGMRPHEKASAMGFKAAAAVMRAHILDARSDARSASVAA